MEEQLQWRAHGDPSLPKLVYLPGLHGDWTLLGGFRQAVAGRIHLIELIYPRTLAWSLADYAEAIETALRRQGAGQVWLLGESFGSQVMWALLERRRLRYQGAILAGGFVRHPARGLVRGAERLGGALPLRLITRCLFGYAWAARWRFRHSPEVLAGVEEFIARRTDLDRRAAVHRLRLILDADARAVASRTQAPIHVLTGMLDPVVPWWPVRRWLRRNCPALRAHKIVWRADHNVLATGARQSAEQILEWIVEPREPVASVGRGC